MEGTLNGPSFAPSNGDGGSSGGGGAAKRLEREGGASLAYHRTKAEPGASGPGWVFLGGFMSDMTGSKALFLEERAKARGRAFLRFDYQGHGESSGRFEEGSIGLWAADAVAAIDELTEGPQVLVGSSMGGWLMLLAALARPEKVAALVGIAAAPDFTEDLMWAGLDDVKRAQLFQEGRIEEPSDYGDEPYVITRRLIEDGRERLLLRDPLPITCPVRLIHGMADRDVPWETAPRLAAHIDSEDVEIHLVKGGGHRLSEPQDLERLARVLDEVTAKVS